MAFPTVVQCCATARETSHVFQFWAHAMSVEQRAATQPHAHPIRLVLSGVLDKYPESKIMLGHLGEGLPFLLWRIDHALSRPGNKSLSFRDVFSRNFYITTSGNFSDPAMVCSLQEMGADRILFSVDWPFVPNALGTDWIERLQLNAEDKAKILNGNAKRLLKL